MRVRIINGSGWYIDLVGVVFEVDERSNGNLYFLEYPFYPQCNYIFKSDAEVVSESADPSKVITGSEQRRRLAEKEAEQTRKNDCLTCQYQVDRPLSKCFRCANNDYRSWEPQAEIVTNNNGGKQSKSEYLWTDFSPSALLKVAKLSKAGCGKYGIDNWKKISSVEHIDHAISHLVLHLNKDTTEDHLTHAAWRVLAALGVNDGK